GRASRNAIGARSDLRRLRFRGVTRSNMQIEREVLRSTLLEEVRAAWSTLRQAHPGERFYAFGIYTTDVVDYLMITASTEEGLSKVTDGYLGKVGGDVELRRASL